MSEPNPSSAVSAVRQNNNNKNDDDNHNNVSSSSSVRFLFAADTMIPSSERKGGSGDGIDGIVCNDAQGLCFATYGQPIIGNEDGKIMNNHPMNTKSGIFTNLIRLANQLEESSSTTSVTGMKNTVADDGTARTTSTTSTGSTSANTTTNNTSSSLSTTPLITIETESFNILVKEYYNRNTFAMKVPSYHSLPTTMNGKSSTTTMPPSTSSSSSIKGNKLDAKQSTTTSSS
jgi:hypothetical protein